MKVVFLHPDFGIGGAERLVLDAALALKTKGHRVQIVTNQFSEDHCFTELKDFKENMDVVAQKLPRTIFGKCSALCAYFRLFIAALYICFNHNDADIVFCDQISAPLPILRIFTPASLLFYCHFPDQLLTKRNSFWKKLYRLLIDQIEAWTMCWADQILVNSYFTENVVRETFPKLVDRPLTILYPSINCQFFDNQLQSLEEHGDDEVSAELGTPLVKLLNDDYTVSFLSINRFERKKCIELAILSFDYLLKKLISEGEAKHYHLVIAGGYDPLNAENIAYYQELVTLCSNLGLEDIVTFVKSPTDKAKIWLMDIADLVVYTPEREHFGIVPVECMYLSTPVLAVNSGGPKETVIHGKTGFLRPSDPESFAQAMATVMEEPEYVADMGNAGRQHVEDSFSFEAFADKLDEIISEMHQQKTTGREEESVNKSQ